MCALHLVTGRDVLCMIASKFRSTVIILRLMCYRYVLLSEVTKTPLSGRDKHSHPFICLYCEGCRGTRTATLPL